MGADFNAAVTPDAVCIVKLNGLGSRIDGLCRTVSPAFPAPFAKLRNDHGPLEKMLSHEALKAFGTVSQRCLHRLSEPVTPGQITVH